MRRHESRPRSESENDMPDVAAAPKRRGMGRGPGAPRRRRTPKEHRSGLKAPDDLSGSGQAPDGDRIFLCHCKHGGDTLTGSICSPIINRFIAPPDGSPGNVAGLFKGLIMMACVYLLGVIANYLQSRLMLRLPRAPLCGSDRLFKDAEASGEILRYKF